MSLLVKQVFSEIERMTLTEQIQVLKYSVEQIDKSTDAAAIPPQPKHKLTDFLRTLVREVATSISETAPEISSI